MIFSELTIAKISSLPWYISRGLFPIIFSTEFSFTGAIESFGKSKKSKSFFKITFNVQFFVEWTSNSVEPGLIKLK